MIDRFIGGRTGLAVACPADAQARGGSRGGSGSRRGIGGLLCVVVLLCFAAGWAVLLPAMAAASTYPTPCTYTLVVPSGVSRATITATGGGGGESGYMLEGLAIRLRVPGEGRPRNSKLPRQRRSNA